MTTPVRPRRWNPTPAPAAVEAYSGAVIAQQWAEQSATQMYAEETRNYRTQALGEGQAPVQLIPWVRKWAADERQQEHDWEQACAAEARTLPQTCLGAPDLDAVMALEEPLQRAVALSGLLDQVQELVRVVSLHRLDAMRAVVASGQSASDIARTLGVTPQAVSKQLRKR